MFRFNADFANQPNPHSDLFAAWEVYQQHELAAHAIFSYVVDGLEIDPLDSADGAPGVFGEGEDLAEIKDFRRTFVPVDLRPVAGRVLRMFPLRRPDTARFAVLRERGVVTRFLLGEYPDEVQTTSTQALCVRMTHDGPDLKVYGRPEITICQDADGNMVDGYFEPDADEAELEMHKLPPLPAELARMQENQYDYIGLLGAVGLVRGLDPPPFLNA